jgi:hypothetical protein
MQYLQLSTDAFFETVVAALPQLQADTQPAWGLMSAQHMLEHLIVVIKGSVSKEFDPSKSAKPHQVQAKENFLMTDATYPQNVRNPFLKEGEILAPLQYGSLEEAKAAFEKALAEVLAFVALPENQEKLFFHLYFGPLNIKEFLRFHQKHIGHHFTQFGLLG